MSAAKLLDQALLKLSLQAIPSDEYIKEGNKAVDEVFKLLRAKSKDGVDRVYISGSMGKKTSILDSDYDVDVFVNIKNLSEIDGVFKDFESILSESKLPDGEVKRTEVALQFKTNGIDIDLLPTINFIKSEEYEKKPGNPQLAADQAFKTLEKIAGDPEKARNYSGSLVETQLKFMQQQSGQVHEFVRLCKLWNKSLIIEEYIGGRSTLIELIAVHAHQEDGSGEKTLLSAFRSFLIKVQNFDQLKIEFSSFDPLAPSRAITNYPKLKNSQVVKKAPFYVIEPANPFANLAGDLVEKKHLKAKFQNYAQETRRRLDLALQSTTTARVPLDLIFEPQTDPKIPFKLQWNFNMLLINTTTDQALVLPSITIRNGGNYGDKKKDVKIVEKMLSVLSTAFLSSYAVHEGSKSKSVEDIRRELKDRVQKFIESNIRNKNPCGSRSAQKVKHDDFDVTITIPCNYAVNVPGGKTNENKFCLQVSFDKA